MSRMAATAGRAQGAARSVPAAEAPASGSTPRRSSAVPGGPSARRLLLYSPSGVVAKAPALRRAARHLATRGYAVAIDEAALARHQRFAGDDATRLAAIHRVAAAAPSVALASRGGYGLTRLIDRLNWKTLGRSIDRGTRWVGMSDCTALMLGALAHGVAGDPDAPRDAGGFWSGPLACEDFGRTDEEGGIDDVTEACFLEAMDGDLEAIGFRTEPGFDGLEASGLLWGGTLTMVLSLLGTPHFPAVRGGVLFLEDVAEHPYRIERMLLQLQQAGVLGAQKAIVLGGFSNWAKSPLDRGYTFKSAVAHLRNVLRVPVLTGLPFGHLRTKVCLPHARRVTLQVAGREAFLVW
jgi:muramoyltetrapeptide carboxypeptidase